MGQGPDEEMFLLEGKRLTVRGEVGPENEKRYSEMLFELLNSGKERLEIDLTRLNYLSSAYIGSTCLLTLVAKQKKRSVTVYANEKIGRLLTIAGLDKLTDVEIVPD